MKKAVFTNSLKTGARIMLLVAISCFSLGTGNVNVAHAQASESTNACGQLLATAEEQFRNTLLPDGSVPASPEARSAAAEYIRVSKICYDQIEAQNSAGALQGDSSTFIDDGGVLLSGESSGEFVLTNSKWGSSTLGTPGGTVTYSFMGNGISFSAEGYGNSVAVTSLPGFQACFITEIQYAFAAWQAVSNIHFVQATDNGAGFNASGAVGDIRIGAHGFDGPSGTLAHAYFPPPNGASAAGDLHFDSDETWKCTTSGGIDIGIVALHEIGHSLGLNHENTPTVAVMDPYYNTGLTGLQADDSNGAVAIYGPAQLVTPPNDDFSAAITIPGISYTNALNIDGATIDNNPDPIQDPDNIGPCTDIPAHQFNKPNSSVWYKYTPGVAESIAADTQGSTNSVGGDLDTLLAVWTVSGSTFTLVVCNDDDFTGNTSKLSFLASPGVTYYFEAGDYNCYFGVNPCNGAPIGGNLVFNVNITNTDVFINNNLMESYYLYSQNTVVDSYPASLNGPVKVKSATGGDIFASQRAAFGGSFNELMGYPADQFTTEYWFPWYDGVYMTTWILVGNPSATQHAYVDIYIGGVKVNNTPGAIPYDIAPGNRVTPKFDGVLNGPVRVVSVTGSGTPSPINLFASERSIYGSSFNELMGVPLNQFTTEYWFPWYDKVYMNTWVLVGNPSATQHAYVDIYIGGVKRNTTPGGVPYNIAPNDNITPQFSGVVNGPVRVVSVTGSGTPSPINIFTSERSLYGSSFNEVMGIPLNQFTTEYWYTWYDNQGMSAWVLVGNPSATQHAYVDIYIGGVKRNTTPGAVPYDIPPNSKITPTFAANSGPVRVVSVTGSGTPSPINIFTSERVIYNSSFNEMMGYPANQLTSEYWFTWYDNVYMHTDVLVGRP